MKTISDLCEIVEDAISKSANLEGAFDSEITRDQSGPTVWRGVESMDHPEYLHMLNLLTYDNSVVCHVGFWKGLSLFSHLFERNPKKVYAVDYFFNNLSLKEEFHNNASRLEFEGRFDLYEGDFRQLNVSLFPEPIDLHIYDADHSDEGQYWGVKHFDRAFANQFILVVDNWNLNEVGKFTEKAIEDLEYIIHGFYKVERHQYQGVFVLEKTNV